MVCDGVCINTAEDEDHCGSCTTVCDPGEACFSSLCRCPDQFVPPNPSFLQQMVLTTTIPNTALGIGGYIGSEIDALIVAMPNAAELNVAYPLSGTNPGLPPFVAAGYDIDLSTMIPTASFYATAGTVTFTTRCAGGFSGTATDVVFSAATGLMPPMLVPGGCTL